MKKYNYDPDIEGNDDDYNEKLFWEDEIYND